LEQVALPSQAYKAGLYQESDSINQPRATPFISKTSRQQGKPEAMEAASFREDIADSAGRMGGSGIKSREKTMDYYSQKE
jgi:hypothetical protein